ncbi:MAG: helix-turn-helix transcriptional regulator [Methylotenera sp.]|nr:helix-turn-helix transcriptional regulator [Methylotenera sp.]
MKTHERHTVAQYLTFHINSSEKTQRQIALEIGYTKPNIITMFKQGLTKLPLEKIWPLANALGIAPDELFYKVMKEYMPETFEALKPLLEGLALSPDEENLLTNYRKFKVLEAKRLAGNKRAKPFKIDWFDPK